MALHSSLKRAEKMTVPRSVLKRTERIKWLMEKGLWKESDRVLGLPKIKVVKLKTVKKEKAKAEVTPEATPQVASELDKSQATQTKAQQAQPKQGPQSKTQAPKGK